MVCAHRTPGSFVVMCPIAVCWALEQPLHVPGPVRRGSARGYSDGGTVARSGADSGSVESYGADVWEQWRSRAPRGWSRGELVVIGVLFLSAVAFTALAIGVAAFGLAGFCDVDCAPDRADWVAGILIVASPGVGLAAVLTLWRRRLRWVAAAVAPVGILVALAAVNALI